MVIESHCYIVKSGWKIGVKSKIDNLGNYLSLLRALLIKWVSTPQCVTYKTDGVTCLLSFGILCHLGLVMS